MKGETHGQACSTMAHCPMGFFPMLAVVETMQTAHARLHLLSHTLIL